MNSVCFNPPSKNIVAAVKLQVSAFGINIVNHSDFTLGGIRLVPYFAWYLSACMFMPRSKNRIKPAVPLFLFLSPNNAPPRLF
jgi:hypothetical protein